MISSMIPKLLDHEHNQTTWTDGELLAHVRAKHQEAPVWLLNESNRELLVREHQKAHAADPISFESIVPPGHPMPTTWI